ncbi:MAG: metallophosphoesterase [Euryarchaeota archaeon]|nr:metallophosphoesterase [Euryarchaeota archaeon]
MLTFVFDEPALIIEGQERILVIADLHIGIEYELAQSGVSIPPQTEKNKQRLFNLIEKTKASKLILLGDIKHNVPGIAWQEFRDIPTLFEELTQRIKIEIIPGNHDGDIEFLLPENVKINDLKGTLIKNEKIIALLHGHSWPSEELLNSDLVIAGHYHPAIQFRDELGHRSTEPAWIRTKLNREEIAQHYLKKLSGQKSENLIKKYKTAVEVLEEEYQIKIGELEILIMPAFNELISGLAFNLIKPDESLGPLLKPNVFLLEEAEVYLLDGTYLGMLKNLQELREFRRK